eukprot:CAMPEP_0195310768 /NCGR_PEP_ID=MMETSP0708-20121125/240_1 /TAXON_ID=33640 /ORGANISM="Asterionellopsis glacialis, Strain CCMP134" /LENGTH=105 /DNA_ID=CAMNT_0040375121 /DNA_START=592 /DNA_END=906 /DNA_ORIENTATION=+
MTSIATISAIASGAVIAIIRLKFAANRGANQTTCNRANKAACQAVIVFLAFASGARHAWLGALILTIRIAIAFMVSLGGWHEAEGGSGREKTGSDHQKISLIQRR